MIKRANLRRWVIVLGALIVAAYLLSPRPKPPDVCAAETKELVAWLENIDSDHRFPLFRSEEMRDVSVVAPSHPPESGPHVNVSPKALILYGERIIEWPSEADAAPSFTPLTDTVQRWRDDLRGMYRPKPPPPFTINLQSDREVPWSRLVAMFDALARKEPTRVSFWFLEAQQLHEPERTVIGGAVAHWFAAGWWSVWFSRALPLKGTECSAVALMAAANGKRPGVCDSIHTMTAQWFIEQTAETFPKCECAMNVDLLKRFAWERYGPGVIDLDIQEGVDPSMEKMLRENQHRWMNYRYIVGAIATLSQAPDAQEIALDGSSSWASVAQPLVDAVNQVGGRPVRFALKRQ